MSAAADAIVRMKHTADVIELERARMFGSARTVAEQVSLAAALTLLDATKARLVQSRRDREGWVL